MSLNGALQVGRSAITASQAALQVAGNNMANAATRGFHRQSVHLSPVQGEHLGRGIYVGQGVGLLAVRREIDTALQARLRDAVSDESANLIDQRFLTAIETLQNELTDQDLSTRLSQFFNSFSELANSPEDSAVRSVVIQQGVSLSGYIGELRADYRSVLQEVDRSLGDAELQVNDLLDRIAHVNQQIAVAEPGLGEAAALRDQRDLLIDELAEYIDISVIHQPNGAADVLVGSIPIVLAGESRGIELRSRSVDDQIEFTLRVKSDGTILQPTGGRIGGLLRQREETIQPAIDALDTFAGQLIFQVNRAHSQGQGRQGFTSVTGTYELQDATANLNASAAGLPFRIENGSFFIHMTNEATEQRSAFQINVDGDAMSLTDLVNEINAVVGPGNVTASIGLNNTLKLDAAPGLQITFSDDTSGALAGLGINSFFSGRSATDIAVNDVLLNDSNMLAAGAGHESGSNNTAVTIAGLQDLELEDLNGRSLRQFWQDSVNDLAVKTGAANAAVQSSALVRDSIAAQVQSVSGVSLDEESINLMTFQRQYQAAARYIGTIDETLQILLSIV